MQKTWVAALLVAAVLAGCADRDDTTDGGTVDLDARLAEALWLDPQNAPHGAYRFPTMSSPLAGATGWHTPIAAADVPDAIAGLEHIVQTPGVESGAGIALYGSLAVVPGFGPPTSIVDISDPTAPIVLSHIEPQQGTHRGAAIIAYPDGRIVTVISTSSIIDVWDITDPTSPKPLPVLEPTQGSHKVGVVPGTPIVYNAASAGGSSNGLLGEGHLGPGFATGVTEIFDLSDPTAPVHVQDFENGYSCHHIYFWNDPANEKYRTICAGIEFTQIWDSADPLAPSVIVSVPVHHGIAGTPSASIPIVAFSHYAGLSRDGTVLLVGDEMGGGGVPPGCVAEVRTASGSVSTPIGALWFYDVSDETQPQLLGWYSPLNDPTLKDPLTSCTAHHGRLVPSEDRDLIAMSFYGDGVILLDFTDPMLPVVVDQFAQGSDTWETWYYNGYLFTGDLNRGMDVLALV